MAYSDCRHDPNRGATIATVALIHVGLGFAIVSGFAGGVIGDAGDALKTTFYPEEQVDLVVPLDPPPAPDASPAQDDTRIDAMPTPWETNADFTVPVQPIPDTFPTARSTDPVPLPTRDPSPSPSFMPKAATPKGSPGLWVRESDYPSRMVRLGVEGKTGFRLSIDGAGRVTGCEVTSSSGAEELDRAACAALRKRATFKGATGADGQPVDSTFESAIVWQLPD